MSETDLIIYQFSRIKVGQGDFTHFLSLYAPNNLPAGPGRILKQLGRPIRRDEIVVVRSGVYVQVAFVWRLGTPGVLRRAPKQNHPFQVSLILRRWLREQRN